MSELYPPTLYCYNHPNTETSLRCQKCERPICPKCAVLTPTGYKCKECVRGQQKVFETAKSYDYLIAIVVAGFLSFLGSLLAARLGWFIIFLSPIAGGIIGEAVRFAVRRRRSKLLAQVAAAAAAIGALLYPGFLALMLLVSLASGGGLDFIFLTAFVFPAIYLVIVTTTVYYRLSGISIGR